MDSIGCSSPEGAHKLNAPRWWRQEEGQEEQGRRISTFANPGIFPILPSPLVRLRVGVRDVAIRYPWLVMFWAKLVASSGVPFCCHRLDGRLL